LRRKSTAGDGKEHHAGEFLVLEARGLERSYRCITVLFLHAFPLEGKSLRK